MKGEAVVPTKRLIGREIKVYSKGNLIRRGVVYWFPALIRSACFHLCNDMNHWWCHFRSTLKLYKTRKLTFLQSRSDREGLEAMKYETCCSKRKQTCVCVVMLCPFMKTNLLTLNQHVHFRNKHMFSSCLRKYLIYVKMLPSMMQQSDAFHLERLPDLLSSTCKRQSAF